MRPVCIYSVSSHEASSNLANYMEAQDIISSLHAQMTQKLALPWMSRVCQHLMCNETPLPMPEVNFDEEEYLPTADLDDPV